MNFNSIIIDPIHIDIIRSINYETPSHSPEWLGEHPSEAFLMCLGSGPWIESRRKTVQEKAIRWLNKRDLLDIYNEINNCEGELTLNIFPFQWQNFMLEHTIWWCGFLASTFKDQCEYWKNYQYINWFDRISSFFSFCNGFRKNGKDSGTKVLWMFVRDFLKLPSFPIDRHIKRQLMKLNLPCDSWYMVKACIEAGIDPSKLNRSMFPKGNPNIGDFI